MLRIVRQGHWEQGHSLGGRSCCSEGRETSCGNGVGFALCFSCRVCLPRGWQEPGLHPSHFKASRPSAVFIKLWRLTLGTILAHYNCLYIPLLLGLPSRSCAECGGGGEPIPLVDHFDLAESGQWQVVAHLSPLCLSIR